VRYEVAFNKVHRIRYFREIVRPGLEPKHRLDGFCPLLAFRKVDQKSRNKIHIVGGDSVWILLVDAADIHQIHSNEGNTRTIDRFKQCFVGDEIVSSVAEFDEGVKACFPMDLGPCRILRGIDLT